MGIASHNNPPITHTRYIQNPSQHPLVIYGPYGSGKTVLMAKLAQSIHDWLPECCLAIRYAGLTTSSQDIPSILESIVHQIGHVQSREIPINSHVSGRRIYLLLASTLTDKSFLSDNRILWRLS